VERTLKKKDASLLVFESHQVLERVEESGDLFAPLLTLKQKLPKLAGIGKGVAQATAGGLEIAAQAVRPAARKPQKTARQTGARQRRRKV
jgi:hypothetical protein